MMDINTFRQKADTYGGDLSRWPKELLPAAVATLKNDASAQAILDDALAFDQTIAALDVPAAALELRTRILGIPDQFKMPLPMQWLLKPTRLAASIALCSLLGLLIGGSEVDTFVNDASTGSAWVLAPDQSMAY